MSEVFVREDVSRFLAQLEALGAPPLESLPVELVRTITAGQAAELDLPAVPLALVRDLACPGPAGEIPLRLYDRREARAAGPLVLYFHGGGFVFGDLESHHAFCTWLADRLDLPVLAVDYRLAPEHPFPAAVEDVEAAARWAANSPPVLGRECTGLIAAGDSAGGNLAFILTRLLETAPAAAPVIAQLAIYPYCGAGDDWPSYRAFGEGYMLSRAVGAWFDQCYRAPAEDERCNCLVGEVPSVPLAILTSGLDPLRDSGRALVEKARAAGRPVVHHEAEGMIHGFVNLRGALPSSVDDLDILLGAFRGLLDSAPGRT